MKSIFLFILCLFLFLFTGCAPKVKIQALKSSNVTNTSSKQIAIIKFKNDNISQSNQIESLLTKFKINNKQYFTIVDRKNFEKLLKEKKLNDSGLIDIENLEYIKGFTQAKSFLFGEVLQSNLKKEHFIQTITDYNVCLSYDNKKNECVKYGTSFKRCQKNKYQIQTNIKLVEIDTSNIIFTNTYNEYTDITKCGSEIYNLPSKKEINTALAYRVARKVLKDIAPSYVNFNVTLLDDLDIKLSEQQEKDFENALKLLSKNRIEKAQSILSKLNSQTSSRSYVILYNLGVTKEASGQTIEAQKLYKKAEDISLRNEVEDEITKAIKRIENNLEEENKLKKLLN